MKKDNVEVGSKVSFRGSDGKEREYTITDTNDKGEVKLFNKYSLSFWVSKKELDSLKDMQSKHDGVADGTSKQQQTSLKSSLLNKLNQTTEKETTIEAWLNELGVDASSLSKQKDSFLDEGIYFSHKTTINYSGSWGVPNPTYTTTYFVDDTPVSKEELKELITKKNQLLHQKAQLRLLIKKITKRL